MRGLSVLVLGNGGREFELTRQLAASPNVESIHVAPGNAGTASLPKTNNLEIDPLLPSMVKIAVEQLQIQLVVIGPEAPIVAGVSNTLRAAGIPVFGPSQQAGQLEASKAFANDFMGRHNIPRPQSWHVHNLEEALGVMGSEPATSFVIKADGLAGGKGVVLPKTTEEATSTITSMFSGKDFGGAGKDSIVLQERLHGPEVSAFALSDGANFILLPFAQDHKCLFNHDQGPNTGGVGAYCPVPSSIVSSAQAAKIREIVAATIGGMNAEGTPYQGVLYVGLMLAEERGGDPVVIEYNARFGDPEAEVILAALSASGCDVADMLNQTAHSNLKAVVVPPLTKTALTVCLSAQGYPENPRKGDIIKGLDKTYENVIVQHAAVAKSKDDFITTGGRVLYVTGIGDNVDEAAAAAYAAIDANAIHFDNMQYRTDIGYQARTKQ